VLHRTKQSLRTWFWAAYLITNLTPSISAKQFQSQLGIKSYETAFCMLHKMRAALVAPGRDKLRGAVEVDEGYVGGREKGQRGRGVITKQIVVGAVELVNWADGPSARKRVRCGRIRLQTVRDVSAESLRDFVTTNVARGSTVFTDGWAAYGFLAKAGYKHRVHVQSAGAEALPHFHRVISNLKTWLKGTYHGAMSAKHLHAYLNEFTFRFNRRFLPDNGFNRALGLAMQLEGPTYDNLYRPESVV
jgi:transposase-like protein